MASIFKAFKTFHQEMTTIGKTLFINVFPSTLTNPTFKYCVQQIKSTVNFVPSSIAFEINEAEKITNLSHLKKTILDLQKQGFLIALDDIGTGESTIKSILEIEPDIVKIDRYFTKDLKKYPKKQKMIEFVLQICGEDAQVIVEGFETAEDLEIAREIGVRFGQGYFLGRPQSIDHYL